MLIIIPVPAADATETGYATEDMAPLQLDLRQKLVDLALGLGQDVMWLGFLGLFGESSA